MRSVLEPPDAPLQHVHVLRILFGNKPIEESAEDKPGAVIDHDKDGNILGWEVLDASKRVENPRSMAFAVTY
jgi:uncharacterized protein YuzE